MKTIKSKTIGIRLTEAELKKVKKIAKTNALATSTFLRQVILKEVQK